MKKVIASVFALGLIAAVGTVPATEANAFGHGNGVTGAPGQGGDGNGQGTGGKDNGAKGAAAGGGLAGGKGQGRDK